MAAWTAKVKAFLLSDKTVVPALTPFFKISPHWDQNALPASWSTHSLTHALIHSYFSFTCLIRIESRQFLPHMAYGLSTNVLVMTDNFQTLHKCGLILQLQRMLKDHLFHGQFVLFSFLFLNHLTKWWFYWYWSSSADAATCWGIVWTSHKSDNQSIHIFSSVLQFLKIIDKLIFLLLQNACYFSWCPSPKPVLCSLFHDPYRKILIV
jgi:hypothetical protein